MELKNLEPKVFNNALEAFYLALQKTRTISGALSAALAAVYESLLEGMHSTEEWNKAIRDQFGYCQIPMPRSFLDDVMFRLTAKPHPDPAVEEFNKHIRRDPTGAYVLTDLAEKIVAQIRDAIRKEAADGK